MKEDLNRVSDYRGWFCSLCCDGRVAMVKMDGGINKGLVIGKVETYGDDNPDWINQCVAICHAKIDDQEAAR
jgi:hypothetical protein